MMPRIIFPSLHFRAMLQGVQFCHGYVVDLGTKKIYMAESGPGGPIGSFFEKHLWIILFEL